MSDDRRIAIVGAGIAGLACARQLREAGANAVLFDKGRGPGGRLSTRRDGPRTFDHGTQYVTARGPEFAAQLEQLEQRNAVANWVGRFVEERDGVRRELPPQRRMVGVPGMNELNRALGEGLDVRYATRVGTLASTDGGVALATPDGESLGVYDDVAIAVPAPQAVALLEGDAQAAPLVERARRAVFAPSWAALAYFEQRPDVDFDALEIATSAGAGDNPSSPLRWVARNTSKPGRPAAEAWIAHASPEFSASFVDDDPDAVAPILTAALTRVLGAKPVRVVAHRWRFALVATPVGEPCARAGRLGLCGDYLLGARVEDAFDSGTALGRALVKPR